MVTLVPMTEEEFQDYSLISIRKFTQHMVEAGTWSEDDALENATRQFKSLLPDGLSTKDHYLSSIRIADKPNSIGVLWFGIRNEGKKQFAYIYDLIIKEEYRNQGYGTQAMIEMEEKVLNLGLQIIDLHVFGSNVPARKMYAKLGYTDKHVIMSKELQRITNQESN